jgi:hypothetical protein
VEIALARSTLISIAIPKSGPTAVKGKTLLKDPVPGVPSIEAEWRFEGTVGHQEKGATTLTAVVVQCAVAGVVGLLAQAVGGLNGGSDGGSVGGLDGGSDGGWQRDVYVGCQTMVVLCLMFLGWRVVHYARQDQQVRLRRLLRRLLLLLLLLLLPHVCVILILLHVMLILLLLLLLLLPHVCVILVLLHVLLTLTLLQLLHCN